MTDPITILFDLDRASPGIMNRKPRKINEPIINGMMFARLFIALLFMAAMALCLFQIGKTGNTWGIKPNLFFYYLIVKEKFRGVSNLLLFRYRFHCR